jgi:hypothetical protein
MPRKRRSRSAGDAFARHFAKLPVAEKRRIKQQLAIQSEEFSKKIPNILAALEQAMNPPQIDWGAFTRTAIDHRNDTIGVPTEFPADYYKAKFGIPTTRLESARRAGRLTGRKPRGRWLYALADVQRLWPDDFD